MFNVVLSNSYLLSSIKLQDEFRVLLYQRLLQVGASTRKRKWVDLGPSLALFQQTTCPDTRDSAERPALEHWQVYLGRREECKGCCLTGRTRTPNKGRVLSEISMNAWLNNRPIRLYYGCLACNIALCKEGPCYERYHKKYVNYQDLDRDVDVENKYP